MLTKFLAFKVTDYLKKKGFHHTERVFREEVSNLGPDGKPVHKGPDPSRYLKAFHLLKAWIEGGIEIYKVSAGVSLPCRAMLTRIKFELRKLLWPIFVYSYLELVSQGEHEGAKKYLQAVQAQFEAVHGDALRELATIALPQHIRENHMTNLYCSNKYRIPLNQTVAHNLFHFLEREAENGGETIAYMLQTNCQVDSTARGPIEPYSFEAIYRRGQRVDLDEADAHEGIPGVSIGVLNRDILDTSAALKLGPLPMEPDLRDDVRVELEEEDQRHPPAPGIPSLVEEFDRQIKREESADVPPRSDLPLPASRARDVVIEMQKVRENRDRFRIEGRTGGAGVPVSVCMFTFHNTLGRSVSARRSSGWMAIECTLLTFSLKCLEHGLLQRPKACSCRHHGLVHSRVDVGRQAASIKASQREEQAGQ